MKIRVTDCREEHVETLDVRAWRRGAFARVFTIPNDPAHVIKVVPDDCYQLHMLAETHSENVHVPKIELLGYARLDGKDVTVFRQPKYRPYDHSNEDGKKLLRVDKALRKIPFPDNFYDCHPLSMNHGGNGFVDHCRKAGVGETVLEALEDLEDWACNYGAQITWEFCPRNLAADEQGNLILLDVLFDPEELLKIRRARAKKAGAYGL